MPSSLSSAFARALACALFLLALTASTAFGATRTGLAVDPAGDGPTPGRDITGVRVHWDSAGSLAVTAAFAGPVGAADRGRVADLLLEFREVSRQSGRSRLTRGALREYNDRYRAVNEAAAEMRREQGRLEQRLG